MRSALSAKERDEATAFHRRKLYQKLDLLTKEVNVGRVSIYDKIENTDSIAKTVRQIKYATIIIGIALTLSLWLT